VSGAVLVVSESAESAAALGAMLGSDHWTIHQARSCDEAVARLVRDRVSVVVCEPRLPDGNWRDMLRYTSHAPNGPALIVTSNPGDEALWAEVLNLGGYDVLAQPFDQSEVARVITSAGRTR
jgi:two-component system, NtrC family, response regulator AtoC